MKQQVEKLSLSRWNCEIILKKSKNKIWLVFAISIPVNFMKYVMSRLMLIIEAYSINENEFYVGLF